MDSAVAPGPLAQDGLRDTVMGTHFICSPPRGVLTLEPRRPVSRDRVPQGSGHPGAQMARVQVTGVRGQGLAALTHLLRPQRLGAQQDSLRLPCGLAEAWAASKCPSVGAGSLISSSAAWASGSPSVDIVFGSPHVHGLLCSSAARVGGRPCPGARRGPAGGHPVCGRYRG